MTEVQEISLEVEKHRSMLEKHGVDIVYDSVNLKNADLFTILRLLPTESKLKHAIKMLVYYKTYCLSVPTTFAFLSR